MDKLAAAVIILAQGVPFLQLGQDFLRSKPRLLSEGEQPDEVNIYSHDSYNAPDHTNSVKWNEKLENIDVFNYYKALIRVRKNNPLFRLRTKDEIGKYLKFLDTGDDNFVVFKLENDETCLIAAFNPYHDKRNLVLPEGRFYTRLNEQGKMNKFPIRGNVNIPPISAMVFKGIKD